MEQILASERIVGRRVALLPVVVVGLCLRAVTLTAVPVAGRAAAAAVVAAACWTAYRLLTARLTVTGTGLHVRGVLYEADIAWAELAAADVVPAAWPLRALTGRAGPAHVVRLAAGGATLRPVATLGAADDHEVRLVMSAIRAHLANVAIPAQRRPRQHAETV